MGECESHSQLMSKFVILNKGVIDKVRNCRRHEGSEGGWDGHTDGWTHRIVKIQPLQMPVVIYSITKAKCAVYFYDCQLYQVSIFTTTYTIDIDFYHNIYFVIGKDLLFQSASRLVICILHCPF